MKIDYDGDIRNVCPLCGNEYIQDTPMDICGACDTKISNEMHRLKQSFSDSYEFDLAVERWLENQ